MSRDIHCLAPSPLPSLPAGDILHCYDAVSAPQIMTDPVACADGFAYNRSTIEGWIASRGATSPITGAALAHTNLYPSQVLRSAALGPRC